MALGAHEDMQRAFLKFTAMYLKSYMGEIPQLHISLDTTNLLREGSDEEDDLHQMWNGSCMFT